MNHSIMKRKTRGIIVSLAIAAAMPFGTYADELTVYPMPEGAEANTAFSVEVRNGESGWQKVPVYNVMVDKVEEKHTVTNSSMCFFDFSGKVDVRIVSSEPVKEARVRPLSYEIKHECSGDTVSFTLDRPRLLSVEVNGDIFNNLQLFANPVDVNRPANAKKFAKGKNNIYFGPGYHKLDSVLLIGSGKNVYIDGGAFIDGVLEVKDARDVNIYGRGLIYPKGTMGLRVSNSRNVNIDGVFTTQCPIGGSDSVRVTNVKVMSYYGWGDGFNVFASNNVHYDGVFARTSDDCTTVYATRKGYKGGAKNILTENSVLWADVAHPIMIGLHGSAKEIGVDAPADTVENIVYRNIDILDHKERQLDYQGCFTINAGDNNLVRDVLFDNVRVEDFRQGRLIDIRIFFNRKYCAAPGQAVENVVFKDITYNGDRDEISLIAGYDQQHKIKGVHFYNLKINGKYIWDEMPGKPKWYKTSDMARIFVGEHVEDLTFDVDPAFK